ncbi:hypothetical protein C7T35_01385 [Variovorax sp. WS11]|uniref:portal protein n=1 Tax=Variovorax sp. WS11 TaxID=1105204 RepID=UPI000D0D57C0|nr:hypothetical protein [Variovorax sp. WS11]NDZ11495.1 hypothetical protein [Variovorax sp. WS11]PSL86647.1 hypothetical protein C7T35_01385 [Variovorax sp. WS11]
MTALTTELNGPKPNAQADDADRLTLSEFSDFFHEVEEQPAWRSKADREMEYYDGNQLSAEILQKQQQIGMPPAIEPLIGPAIDAVLGLEAKTRADWRVLPDGDQEGDDVAQALNYKLNQAERQSKADQACSDAFKPQVAVGLGWVEVGRNPNPFQYQYRCRAIHRNEIWWDMLSVEPDLSDARYLIRRRWTPTSQAKLLFPGKQDLITQAVSGWPIYEGLGTTEGGTSTDLASAWDQQRGWSVEEQQWRDMTGKRVCLFETWYRRWKRVLVLKTPDGRVVEYDRKNAVHVQLVAVGATVPEWAIVPKMRRSMWMGPHMLDDGPTPYRHQKFPYIPFWGKKEDRTGVPYGLVRGMVYMQDNVNATNSKLRWGLSAVRTTRTKGAIAGTDEQFRQEIARVDADIVLSQEHMAKQGATFKVERDFELNQQQYQMLQDSRAGIQRVSGITDSLQGGRGNATSGVQEATQLEQSTQALAEINDNFATARAEVGDMLLSLIVEDMIGREETVKIKGDPLRDEKEVQLNVPTQDEGGYTYLDNDVERTKLKVALNDVPSTPSYRSQQLTAMSEAFKAMPVQYQQVAMPYLIALMDLPNREDIIKAVREASAQMSPEQIQERIDQAVAQARMQDARDLKLQELSMRYPQEKLKAEIGKLIADAFKTNVEALYSANQTAATIAMNPAIAPVADVVAQAAGYQPPNPVGQNPNLPVPAGLPPAGVVDVAGTPGVAENTSPTQPPVPQAPPSPLDGGMQGIETERVTDNAP